MRFPSVSGFEWRRMVVCFEFVPKPGTYVSLSPFLGQSMVSGVATADFFAASMSSTLDAGNLPLLAIAAEKAVA